MPVRETIPAGEAREIGWDFTVPAGLDKLTYEVVVQETEGPARDRIKVSQLVAPAVSLRTFQATLRRLEDPVGLEVERPAGALPGRGGIRLGVTPKLTAGLSAVVDYMKGYPYICLEQKVSKAVVLGEKGIWQSILDDLPAYLDDQGLVKYFPGMRQGSDTLTSYLLAVSQEAGLELADPIKNPLLKGLRDFVEGRVIRPSVLPSADLPLRKLTAIEALSRYGRADQKLISTLTIEPQRWPTSAVLDWLNILRQIKEIPDRSKKLKETETVYPFPDRSPGHQAESFR